MTSIWEIESLVNLKNKLKNILISRKVDVSDDDNLSTLVDKVNDVKDNVELNGLLSDDLTELRSENLTKLRTYAFTKCTKLTKIDIPNCIYIHYHCFESCGIKELKMYKAGNTRGEATFYGCNYIEKIILPNFSMIEQAYQTFYNCTNLKVIDILNIAGNQIQLFLGCFSLNTLILRRNTDISPLSTIQSIPFFKNDGLLYVPETLLDSYKTATNWSTIANRIIKLEGTIYEDIYWSNKDMMFISVDSIEYEIPKDTTVLQYKNTYRIEHLYSDGTELADDKLLHDYLNTTITTEVK